MWYLWRVNESFKAGITKKIVFSGVGKTSEELVLLFKKNTTD